MCRSRSESMKPWVQNAFSSSLRPGKKTSKQRVGCAGSTKCVRVGTGTGAA